MDANQRWIPVKAWEDFSGYANVYLYAGLQDKPGSGRAVLDIQSMASVLDLSPRTCRDYVRRCRQYGFFRWIEWSGADQVKVYYSALDRMIALYSGPGNCQVQVGESDLMFKKAIIVEAIAQNKQEQSYYNRIQEIKGPRQYRDSRVLTVGAVFGGRSSVNASGASRHIMFRTTRFTLVSADAPTIGASLPTIAAQLGRSPRTASRRLSNRYRQRLADRHQSPLAPLPRVQLAKDAGPQELAQHLASESFGENNLILAFGRAWKPGCNVYLPNIDTKGQKRRNKRIAALDTLDLELPGLAAGGHREA